HCQVKYWIHIPICATRVACRWVTGGLPYCWRVSTSHNACRVVGSPSLIGGKCAARMGRKAYTERPTAATTSTARAKSQLRAYATAYTNAAANKTAASTSGAALSSPVDTMSAYTLQNTSHCDHSSRRAASSAGRSVLSGGYRSTATTGPTSTQIMWLVEVRASRYTIIRR